MKLTKKAWILFLILMCIVNMVVCVQYYATEKNDRIIIGENLTALTGEITVQNSVRSQFFGNGNALAAVEVFFSTYNRENPGKINLSVSNEETVVFAATAEMKDLKDNSFWRFDCSSRITLKEGEEYTITVYSETEADSITAWLDQSGNLVANIETVQTLPIARLVATNLFYALINYSLCLLVCLLKRK